MKSVPVIFLIFLLINCKKEEITNIIQPDIIENQTFNSTLLFNAHDFAIIRKCIFEDGDERNIDGLDII
ncbi:MAG: hypothetical protein CMO01_10930 [Thalassobius sp.]|nr:hypothetical protein [Thalassovita sp.]